MANTIGSGLIDLIVALVAVEALALALWRRKTGRGPAILPLLCTLLAGTFLLLALRNALAGASPAWIAICLLAAFAAHVLDLRERWNASPPRPATGPEKSSINATLTLRVPEQKSRRNDRVQTGE